MPEGNGLTGYLFVVRVGDETSMLNRQQLLGSMPKILDGLSRGTTVTIKLIDPVTFEKLVQKVMADDMAR